eukprot:413134-Amphidinium_carterae.1
MHPLGKVVDTEYYGKFKVPYPSCSYLRCRSPPAAENVQNFAEFVPATSTDGIDCAGLTLPSRYCTSNFDFRVN